MFQAMILQKVKKKVERVPFGKNNFTQQRVLVPAQATPRGGGEKEGGADLTRCSKVSFPESPLSCNVAFQGVGGRLLDAVPVVFQRFG